MATRFDATRYLEPFRRGRVRYPVSLSLTEHTYGASEDPTRSWIPMALRSFARVGHEVPVRDLLIIGTGNGLDVLGALEIFDLKSLLVTDIHADSLCVARQNVVENLVLGVEVDVQFRCSDLLSSVPTERRFCLIYENLPNLPLGAGINVDDGVNAASFFAPREDLVPARFEAYRLALHYICLRQAKLRVRRGGGVLTSIGGRIPLDVAFDLHRSCGYSPELVVFDAKIQSEPESVIPAYAQAEHDSGLRFAFYLPEILPLVAAQRDTGLEGLPLAESLAPELNRFSLTARDALRRHDRGELVAHTVFCILGKQGSGDEG